MLSLTDLKNGVVIELDGAPYEVVRYQHSKMGRGGAIMRTTLKNLITGNNI
ncbi:MAG: elongation factor P, partial [bacterium]